MRRNSVAAIVFTAALASSLIGCKTQQAHNIMSTPFGGSGGSMPSFSQLNPIPTMRRLAERTTEANPFRTVSSRTSSPISGGNETLLPTPDTGMPTASSVPSLY